MEEIRKVPRNSWTVASLFSGCGGSDLGFEMAGFETVFASEFAVAARNTYRQNFPRVPIDERDVRLLSGADIPLVDVLVGSPPCASFSMSARRETGLEKGWGKEKDYGRRAANRQRTDDLFYEFVRILGEVKPRAFVAENVFGLVRGKAKGHFLRILAAMKGHGYAVEARALDAQWLGVPQVRNRIIFVGIRASMNAKPELPTPFGFRYSVSDALEGLPEEVPEPETRVEGYAIGPHAAKLRQGEKSEKFFNLRRLHAGSPARTVLANSGHPGAAGPLHPTENRKPTIRELKRICGFPDDFVLTGKFEQRWERLGRAVPPPMMFAVASCLARTLAASSER